MKYIKTLEVKSPNRGTTKSAGIDFFVPEHTFEFVEAFISKNSRANIDINGIDIEPHGRVNIPSGIKANVPEGFALIAYNKSGVSLKYGLDTGACVVDEDYQGVIHLSLVNTTDEVVHIDYGQKIIQFILIPVFYDTLEEVENESECFTETTERGSGAFGSTGTK